MTFDPTVYEKPKVDMQEEPNLPEDQWIARFVAFMTTEGMKQASDEFKDELPDYAASVAPSYLVDRKEYVSPEEAAETDMSYWEDEE